ncbi:Midasin [Madurella mycetomatis]|uniref:Midasin n=1 Tax=Madurella mycetomatis TaxID=100816 RepID=A0A175W2E5_9PEZI|nr:Midasin [Madurella mycetomatis]
MPRKIHELDLDFQIYVDPSCVSNPMEEDIPPTQLPPSSDAAQDPAAVPAATEETTVAEGTNVEEESAGDSADVPTEEPQDETALDTDFTSADDPVPAEQPEPEVTDEAVIPQAQEDAPEADVPNEEIPALEEQAACEEEPAPEVQSTVAATEELLEDTPAIDDDTHSDPPPETDEVSMTEEALAVEEPSVEESTPDLEQLEESGANDPALEAEGQEIQIPADEPAVQVEEEATQDGEQHDENIGEPVAEAQEANDAVVEECDIPREAQVEGEPRDECGEKQDHHEDLVADDDTQRPTRDLDSDAEDEEQRGRQPSTVTDRKTSLRTEALIQAAARAVVAKIEKRNSGGSVEHDDEDELDNSLLSTGSQETYGLRDADEHSTYDDHQSPSRRPSSESQLRHSVPSRSASGDEGGDSSSHNEHDDDVFSDRSARSSLCSVDANDIGVKTPQAKENLSRRESYASSRPSPRDLSGISSISGLSQYDKEQFVPTSRENRMPFRTPSEIRAMQMGSPTPSVFNGSSPRSSKRHAGSSTGILPPLSRIGSPTISAQYSPKGRSTPPRFKSRKEAPLVLLHVTLLPLRWAWGDVLSGLDSINGKALTEFDPPFEASEQLKTLRDSWRELQCRVGDTVLERGILLPHPQNDYEVLEERLLEALELPLRRRARILECGHYLGPANVMPEDEEDSEDDEYVSQAEQIMEEKKHWCNTCRNEIRYEDLGPGKVFRVKVYASNGLMKAGAWEACWKEMERVDVEVEPIVDSSLQNELEKLGALQLEQEEQQRRQEAEPERNPDPEPEAKRDGTPEPDQHTDSQQPERLSSPVPEAAPAEPQQEQVPSSRPASAMHMAINAAPTQPPPPSASTSITLAQPHYPQPLDTPDERRRRDEERMHPRQRHPEHYMPPQQPQSQHRGSPSEEAYRGRRQGAGSAEGLENAGFVELLMEAFKVLLRDPKNVAIIVLCVFLTVLMKRPGMSPGDARADGNAVVLRDAAAAQGGYRHAGYEQPPVVVGTAVEGREKVAEVPRVVVVPEVREEVLAAMPVPEVAGMGVGVEVAAAAAAPASAPEVASVAVEEVPAVEPALELEAETPVEQEVRDFTPVEDVLAFATSGLEPSLSAESESAEETAEVSEAAGPSPEVDAQQVLATPADAAESAAVGAEETAGSASVPETEAVEEGAESPAAVDQRDPALHEVPPVMTEPETVPVEDYVAPTTEADNNLPTEPESDIIDGEDYLCDKDVPSSSQEPVPDSIPSTDATDCLPHADYDYNSDYDGDSDKDGHSSASSSEVFIPGPYVTERKTVRVFETLTETVRVSVVTQTETVSTVVTAVPQTVEETVFETETVRITVSVPVEERKKRAVPTCRG